MRPDMYEALIRRVFPLNGLPDFILSQRLTLETARLWNACVDRLVLEDPVKWRWLQDELHLSPEDVEAIKIIYRDISPARMNTERRCPSEESLVCDETERRRQVPNDGNTDADSGDSEASSSNYVYMDARHADDEVSTIPPFSADDSYGMIGSTETDPRPVIDPLPDAAALTRPDAIVTCHPEGIYVDRRAILHDWSAHGVEFHYTGNGELEEPLTASQFWTFSMARGGVQCLTVRIQKRPADAAHRFMSGAGPKCLLAECPLARLDYYEIGAPIIAVGDYMVALDELSGRGPMQPTHNCDPFAVSGHIHLYCIERFVGLIRLCRNPRITMEVTTSPPMFVEDKASLALEPFEAQIAQRYIEVLKTGDGRPLEYPSYGDFSMPTGAYRNSLTQVLHQEKWNSYNEAMQDQLASRENEGTMSHVHKGDLEVVFAAKMFEAGLAHKLKASQRSILTAAKEQFMTNKRKRRRG